MSKTQNTLMVEFNNWHSIPWKQAQRQVFRLQKRIYRASLRNDYKTVHKLQKLLTKSWYAKAIAIRKVMQVNRGKKTAGIDGKKTLNPKQRCQLIGRLQLDVQASPVKRIDIPKPNGEVRHLGIPTMEDRAKQALAKLALEPEWEAKFEPNSYGFRTGRSAHDAIAAIYSVIRTKEYYVLDADIEKCFDQIDHKALLDKLNSYPTMRKQVKAWLKAGVMVEANYLTSEMATPQGGVISPLLANIALHGMEEVLKQWYPKVYVTKELAKKYGIKRDKNFCTPLVFRYGDDFVILHESKILIEECKGKMNEWLKGIGLHLKESKTTIAPPPKEKTLNGASTSSDSMSVNMK